MKRRTLTIETDVDQLLLQEMERTNSSMKKVVNDTLRAGLGDRGKSQVVPRYNVEPFSSDYQPGIDPNKLSQTCDELEDEEFARRFKP